ncbi:fungal zn(2)-Cys(6) binuclear cluster domain-containing protein [Trichoderma breve]|uniref:Fungal zn(2)-Cys(6) binuclear cluster domain-containing protein n=1 Tax=Trichoderma breve TaxID=2034170 RepID=A0A9W9EEN0_9HYPO|nr:fungal zn(2)-Cys(6) binuclear cluster domain-containing protein [Trichoderma breve]KAJ4865308.1 fungal zn(2)-Cys(6) binuclear cluster domain-containing protein [Trichoderma breve]
MPPERLIETKAQKACRHCRLHKRRCDKRLPRCSRCSLKLLRCEYDDKAPIEETEPDTKLLWSEHLAIKRDSCGLELTPAGEKQLLWIACQTQEQHSDQVDTKSLMSLVSDIFKYGDTSAEQVSNRYFATAHHWIPIVDAPRFKFTLGVNRIYTELYHDSFALLLLCMLLMNQQPCYHPNHTPNSALYRTTRRLFSLLNTPTTDTYSLARLQAGLLLSAYECGHGMAREASSTLASCFGLIRQLDMIAVQNKAENGHGYKDTQEPDRRLCWASIVFLDRSVVLSCADNTAALLIPSSAILPQDAVPYMNKDKYALMNTATKFQTRAYSALLIGEAIKAVHGESYPVCEGVTMALSAVVSAYRNRAKRLGWSAAPDAKLNLDLQFAYNIVFEMCRVEGLIMGKRDTSLNRMCFSGLGCLYRAAVDLVEVYPTRAVPEDVKQLRENLEWFSGHWKVADVLLQRLNRNVKIRSLDVALVFHR